MEILYLLVPLSVVLALFIGVALWWAVRSDQFEDLDAAGARILLDEDRPPPGAAGGTSERQAASASRGEGELGGT